MIERHYSIQTGEWTEAEVPDPEPIAEPDTTPRAETNIEAEQFFTAMGETYKTLCPIVRGEKFMLGVNCEIVNLTDILNNQLKESEE